MPTRMNAQPRLGIHFIPTDDADLITEMEGDRIRVGSPNGSFRVTYYQPPGASQLILASEWWSRASLPHLARLRARAWRLANDAAAELGWFKDAYRNSSRESHAETNGPNAPRA
jgi:hypothetical protein